MRVNFQGTELFAFTIIPLIWKFDLLHHSITQILSLTPTLNVGGPVANL